MLPDWSSCVSADARCKTNAKADIILLVDGSWSIGRLNFRTIRNFIARTVSVFDIGPQRVQIGKYLSVLPLTTITFDCHYRMNHFETLNKKSSFVVYHLKSLFLQVWLSTAETQRQSGTSTPTQLESRCSTLLLPCRTKEATLWQVIEGWPNQWPPLR